MHKRDIRWGAAAAAMLVLSVAVACGSGPSAASTPANTTAPAATSVDVTVAEWSVKPSVASVKAGAVNFVVANNGTIAHEFVVAQTGLADDQLPQANGSVDEKQTVPLGRTANIDPGKSETKSFDLKPGKYVLFCNLPAHYGQGMHVSFTVQ